MNNIFYLTKTMFGSDETLSNLGLGGKKKKSIFSKRPVKILLFLLLFLSMGMSTGSFAYMLYDSLSMYGFQSLIIRLAVPASGITVFMFGIFYVMNVFFFSRDIENYLFLPVRPGEILMSKFLVALVYQYFIYGMLFMPVLLVYGFLDKAGPLFYLYVLIVTLFVPVLPMVAASLIAMIIMRAGKGIKNKDRFNMIAGVLGLTISLGFSFGIQYLAQRATTGNMVITDLSQLPAIKVTSLAFPTSYLASEALVAYDGFSGLMFLLALIAVSLLSMAVFYVVGNAIYFKGVMGVLDSSSRRKKLSTGELDKETSSKPILLAYSLKELKLLMRTPAYFMNCVLVSLIFPLFFIIPFLIDGPDSADIKEIMVFLRSAGDANLLVVMTALGLLLGGLNIISSTSISREGKNFFFMKYVPVPYMTQLYAKILSSFYVEGVAAVILYGLLILLFKPSMIVVLLSIPLFILASIFMNQFSIAIDVYMPKLEWDSEQKAVKQNLNSMFQMFGSFIFGGGMIFLSTKFTPTLIPAFLALLVIFGALVIITHKFLERLVEKRFAEL
jgi:ABC-2 type transport system permease protein